MMMVLLACLLFSDVVHVVELAVDVVCWENEKNNADGCVGLPVVFCCC